MIRQIIKGFAIYVAVTAFIYGGMYGSWETHFPNSPSGKDFAWIAMMWPLTVPMAIGMATTGPAPEWQCGSGS